MEWTRERPQASGYYWFVNVHDFNTPDIKPQIIRIRNVFENVRDSAGNLMPAQWHIDFLRQAQDDLVEKYEGCWYGPITMPEFSHCPGW